MKFLSFGRAALVVTAGVFFLNAPTFAQTNVRVLSAWSSNLSNVKEILYAFEKNVGQASGGKINFQNNGPEVVPPFEQLQPLSAGAFDFLYTAAAYQQAQTGVSLSLALIGDITEARKAGLVEQINDYYRKKFGVEVLAFMRAPQNEFVMRKPLVNGAGVEGRKFRSNAIYDPVVRSLGAVPVSMSPADAYAAMDKGALDGIAFPTHAVADFKLYEVGKFMTRPNFGRAYDMLMVNSKKLASLAPEQQKIIREQGIRMEQEGTVLLRGMADRQHKTMEDNGVKITEFSPETHKKNEKNFNDGVAELSRKSPDADAADAIIKFGRSKGVMY